MKLNLTSCFRAGTGLCWKGWGVIIVCLYSHGTCEKADMKKHCLESGLRWGCMWGGSVSWALGETWSLLANVSQNFSPQFYRP